MALYTVVGHVAASVSEDIEAESPEEAAQRAAFDFSLCHACSRELEAGGVFDVEVLDEDGEVVLESELDQELAKLHARIRELEAQPVVPYPYEVIELDGRWRLYEHQCSETDPLARLGQDGTGVCAEYDMGDASVAPDAVRGLIYAIETGKRPPHEADGDGDGEADGG